VLVSLPTLLAPVTGLGGFSVVLLLRLGRLFRLFRLLFFIPDRDHLALGIKRSLRASVGVFLALLLINIILGTSATVLFADAAPQYFGNPLLSCYSLFKVFTIEGWYEIPERLEDRAAASGIVTNLRHFSLMTRGFFVIAVFIGGILGLSLANAVFVDEMMMDNTEELDRKVDLLTDEVRALRRQIDENS